MIEPSEAALSAYVTRREEVLAQVRAVLIEDLGVPLLPAQIDPDTPLFGLGLSLDSVDAVDLILGLEDRSGIVLPDGAAATPYLRTVNTLVDYVLASGPDMAKGSGYAGPKDRRSMKGDRLQ